MKNPFARFRPFWFAALHALLLIACAVACTHAPSPLRTLGATPAPKARATRAFRESDAGFSLESRAARVVVDRGARIHLSSSSAAASGADGPVAFDAGDGGLSGVRSTAAERDCLEGEGRGAQPVPWSA